MEKILNSEIDSSKMTKYMGEYVFYNSILHTVQQIK